MANIDPAGQALIDEYLDCWRAKEAFKAKLELVKAKLLAYSQETKQKTFITPTARVTVTAKQRTVFPKINQPGRKELEQAVKAAGYWQEALSFDVVKLAEAYDDNRLPPELKASLAGLGKTDRQLKVLVYEQEIKPD